MLKYVRQFFCISDTSNSVWCKKFLKNLSTGKANVLKVQDLNMHHFLG